MRILARSVADGDSDEPQSREPSPRLRRPSPARAGEETGLRGGRLPIPRCGTVSYPLSPRQVGADFINEFLTQDTSINASTVGPLPVALDTPGA